MRQVLKYRGSVTVEFEEVYYSYRCCKFNLTSQTTRQYTCPDCNSLIVPEIQVFPNKRKILWTKYRELIFKRDDSTCQNCGSKFFLQIHHIDYNTGNAEEKNLVTACSSCNTKSNFDKEYWKEYYSNKVRTKPSMFEEIAKLLK